MFNISLVISFVKTESQASDPLDLSSSVGICDTLLYLLMVILALATTPFVAEVSFDVFTSRSQNLLLLNLGFWDGLKKQIQESKSHQHC